MAARFEFTTKSDVPDVHRLLRKLSGTELRGAMKVIGRGGENLARQAFQDAEAPDGTAWPALQESTLNAWVGDAAGRRRRRQFGTRPLIRQGTLMNSITSRLVDDATVAVGTAQAHGIYHQGDPNHPSRGIIPPRRFLPELGQPLPDEWRQELVGALEEYLEGGQP